VRSGGLDIQHELDRLEEMVLDSPRVPFGRRTLIDEEQLLDQLDLIRINLPVAFRDAEAVIREKDRILLEAEQRAQDILDAAREQAMQMIEETTVVRQANYEAENIRRQVQQECDGMRDRLAGELDQMREDAALELEDMRRAAIAECEAIQDGADDYADRVLGSIENQLGDMLRVVRNGRHQLQQQSPRALEAGK
jgi:cell division septum initiation protein DivIVA